MRKRTPRPVRVITWNCYIGNDSDHVLACLRAWSRAYAPDVIMLSEARTHHHVLDRLTGYTAQQETPKRYRGGTVNDAGDSALLIRDQPARRTRLGRTRPAIVRQRLQRMRRTWTVWSKRRRHTPRAYEVAVVWIDGHRWRFKADHWPTLGFHGPNRRAFRESARRTRRWLRATWPRTSSVAAGDLNEHRRTLARWLGKRFRVFGAGIDVALTYRVVDGECTELGTGGSDHHGRLYELTPR